MVGTSKTVDIKTVSDRGLWVDNSKMTIEETVSYIHDRIKRSA